MIGFPHPRRHNKFFNMNDIFKILQTYEHQSDGAISEADDLAIRKAISSIFNRIRVSSSNEESNRYFDTLQKTQEILAKIVCKDGKKVSIAALVVTIIGPHVSDS